ncbi:hypothetical protein [Georgenia sp. Marseille-Q6866]
MRRSEHGPDAALERLGPTLQSLYEGLCRGLAIAVEVHRQHRWRPAADLHLFHHIARREAMAHLRDLDPRLDEEDNLGLPMSGLLLHPTPVDVLRVWHSDDGHVRAPVTHSGQRFVSQRSAAYDLFTDTSFSSQAMPDVCKTYVQWAARGSDLTRFDLVRPRGTSGGFVEPDWTVPLLEAMRSPAPGPGCPEIDADRDE